MANTQFIKKTVEPFIRDWLRKKFSGEFEERKVTLRSQGKLRFDAVSIDRKIVANIVCNRAYTAAGNENTGGVRKTLNDIQYLNLVRGMRKFLVFTDTEFMDLIQRRAERVGRKEIDFLYCELPQELSENLEKLLDNCSREQNPGNRSNFQKQKRVSRRNMSRQRTLAGQIKKR